MHMASSSTRRIRFGPMRIHITPLMHADFACTCRTNNTCTAQQILWNRRPQNHLTPLDERALSESCTIHKYLKRCCWSFIMTFHNLNGNWIDTLTRQYKYDLQEGNAHPIKYLLFNQARQRNIFYYIPRPIDVGDFRKSLVKYGLLTKNTSTFEWEDQHIQVWPHSGDHTNTDAENQLAQYQDKPPNRFQIAAAAAAASGRTIAALPSIPSSEKHTKTQP